VAAECDAGVQVDARARPELPRDAGEQRVEAIRADARVPRGVIVQPEARGSVRAAEGEIPTLVRRIRELQAAILTERARLAIAIPTA
jgi:hypothetical protein